MATPEPTRGSLLDLAAREILKAGLTLNQARQAVCRQMILIALKEHSGNLCRTANALHIHRNTLSRQVDLHHLHEAVRKAELGDRQKKGTIRVSAERRLDQSRVA